MNQQASKQSFQRRDGRTWDQLRKISFTQSPQKDPAGSVLIEWGHTKVICSASVEEKTPPWMNDKDGGWITAEYNMLPGSTDKRIHRDRARNTGRTHEIQRLIGRSLRAAIDLKKLGPRTLLFDCDVLQADGGTRVASITGAYLALRLALEHLVTEKRISQLPALNPVAAISLGRVKGQLLCDLDYVEDSQAELDANVVMNGSGQFIEVQATAEKGSFSKDEWAQMMSLAQDSCENLFQIQEEQLKAWGFTQ